MSDVASSNIVKPALSLSLSISLSLSRTNTCNSVFVRRFQELSGKKKPQKVSEQSKSFAWHPEARRPNLSRQPGQQCVPTFPSPHAPWPLRLTSLLLYETRNRHSRPELGPERAQTHGKHTSNWQCAEWKRRRRRLRRRPNDKGSYSYGHAPSCLRYATRCALCAVF